MNVTTVETSTFASFNNTTVPENGSKKMGNGNWKSIAEELFFALEILTLFVLVFTIWTLLSMIIYGTKTRRWKKHAARSSLSTGAIYVYGTIAITVCISFPIVTFISFQFCEGHTFAITCKEMGDITVGAHVISSYVIYLFLWRLQRLIYKHSYVRPNIKPWVNWLSRFFCVFITISATVLIVFYILLMDFTDSPYGCVLAEYPAQRSLLEPTHRNALVVPVAVINFLVIFLFIYPAARVKFETQVELDDMDAVRRESIRPRYPTLAYVQKWAHSVAGKSEHTITSPIELAVRRGVTSCVIVVFTDLVTILVTQAAFPFGYPIVISMGIYNVALVVKIFAMIFSFSFGSKVFKVLIPHCRKHKRTQGGNSVKRGSQANSHLVNITTQ